MYVAASTFQAAMMMRTKLDHSHYVSRIDDLIAMMAITRYHSILPL